MKIEIKKFTVNKKECFEVIFYSENRIEAETLRFVGNDDFTNRFAYIIRKDNWSLSILDNEFKHFYEQLTTLYPNRAKLFPMFQMKVLYANANEN